MKTNLFCVAASLLVACHGEERKSEAGGFGDRTLAVAELKNELPPEGRKVSASYLADRLRIAVLATAPHPHLSAKAAGADYVLGGTLKKAGEAYALELEAKDAQGKSLATQKVVGKSSEELDAALGPAVKKLLDDVRAPPPPPLAPVAAAPAEAMPMAKPVEMPGEQVLDQQPKLLPLAPFAAPVPKIVTLPNGLRVYLVERKGDGIEAVNLILRRGGSAAADKPGLASLTASMMETGAAGKSQIQLAAAADAIGGSLHISSSQFATVAGISAMPSRLSEMAALLGEVALKPTFAEAEWKRIRAQREAELVAARAQPVTGADHAFRAAAYGTHPLGKPLEGTAESVQALQLADVKAFYAGFSPKDAALVAVGGASEKDVVAALRKAFGGWKAAGKPAAELSDVSKEPLPTNPPRLVLVDFPAKPQSVLFVGQPSVPRSSPDYLALELLNAVLGGSFTSRLNQNLREVHGYSYGAGSTFQFGRGPGAFFARTSVKTDVTGAALSEVLSEIGRAVAEPLTEGELARGKALLTYGLTEQLSHADSAAGSVAAIFIYDLRPDEYATFVQRIQGLTVADVKAAAQRALKPAAMTITIAGDLKSVRPQLDAAKLGLPAPQLRDASGSLLK